jgi:DNA-binding transcriptional MerR regulator
VAVSSARNYHTIGEVLNMLKDEFPDISISKIRFLESQGLLQPERTASGYRKFVTADVERLRFILREQRDRFLPLKVIKSRLDAWERGELDAEPPGSDDGESSAAPLEDMPDVALVPSEVQMDRRELAAASGLSEAQISELERYGLVEPQHLGGDAIYDECALIVAKISRGFLKYGIEPRHLRMFRQAVDREVALFEQVVSPMVAQRNPEARRQAATALGELGTLAKKLHQALLAQGMRQETV